MSSSPVCHKESIVFCKVSPSSTDTHTVCSVRKNEDREDPYFAMGHFPERAEMFYAAFGSGNAAARYTNIFSLSIQPKDPDIEQPIYGRNAFADIRMAAYCSKHSSIESNKSVVLHSTVEASDPKTVGFLQPSPDFKASKELNPESLEDLPFAEIISSPESIESSIVTIGSPDLKSRVRTILSAFMRDASAQRIYLITLDPANEPGNQVVKRFFCKLV